MVSLVIGKIPESIALVIFALRAMGSWPCLTQVEAGFYEWSWIPCTCDMERNFHFQWQLSIMVQLKAIAISKTMQNFRRDSRSMQSVRLCHHQQFFFLFIPVLRIFSFVELKADAHKEAPFKMTNFQMQDLAEKFTFFKMQKYWICLKGLTNLKDKW